MKNLFENPKLLEYLELLLALIILSLSVYGIGFIVIT